MRRINALITAGPTYEPIDPVRFITNRSKGTMGYAIAEEAVKRNYNVILISGPVNLKPPPKAKFICAETALDMKQMALKEFGKADCVIMAAAVSDFRVKKASHSKIKKKGKYVLTLVENPDILKSFPKDSKKVLVGFALETGHLLENAKEKLYSKNLDLLIANKIDKKNTPFGDGRKDVVLLRKGQEPIYIKNRTKQKIAASILDAVGDIMKHKHII